MLAHALLLSLLAQTPGPPAAKPGPVAADPDVEPLLDVDDVKGLKAAFFVAAPPDQVLETLWDVKRFRQIFPDIKSLEVLAERGDSSVDAKFFVDAVFKDVSYTLRRDVDRKARVITWKSIGGDLKVVRGSWMVLPTSDPAVSKVVYTSFVDIGSFVPTGMVRDVAMGKVNQMAARVRAACVKKS